MAKRSIGDLGRELQKYGLNIGEHPEFGGVGKGHSPTGYHPTGEAIDVRDWRPDVAPAYQGGKPISWKQRTGELSWRAKQLGLFNEALGPGDKGHDTHVHLALQGQKFITNPQIEWLATGRYKTPEGKLTDVMPGATQPTETTASSGVNYEDAQAKTNDLIEAFMLGTNYQPREKKQTREPQSLLGAFKNQILGGILQNAMNPLAGILDQPGDTVA
jgi:hypothetical protein